MLMNELSIFELFDINESDEATSHLHHYINNVSNTFTAILDNLKIFNGDEKYINSITKKIKDELSKFNSSLNHVDPASMNVENIRLEMSQFYNEIEKLQGLKGENLINTVNQLRQMLNTIVSNNPALNRINSK